MTTATCRSRDAKHAPPVPPGNLLPAIAPSAVNDMLGLIEETCDQYGEFVHVRLCTGRHGFLLADPDHDNHVRIERSSTYNDEVTQFDVLGLAAGRGIVGSNCAQWKEQQRCIGEPFVLFEAMLKTATIAQKVRLRLTPGQVIEPKAATTLRPRDGMFMDIEARQ